MKTNGRSKRQDSFSKMILEEIIGLTSKNANGLASNISTSCCAYVAGCVVVVYDVESGKQSHLMVSHRTPKPLSCVAVSPDGHFIAAGESGNQPTVLVWDHSTMAFVSELKDHLYGVECVSFSPDGEHLVSVGGYIYLWNWRSGLLVTKLKASSCRSAVTSVSFSADAKFVITAGKKHLKVWTVGSSPATRFSKRAVSLTMHGKPVNLGPQKGSSFTSVTSAMWTYSSKQDDPFPVYALTSEGILCIVDCGLSVSKSVDLKVEKGFALSVSDKLIACACCNGIVQLFTSDSLNYAGSLLYSKAKSFLGETDGGDHPAATEKDFQLVSALPDAVACQFSTSDKLVVVYGDHTLCIWDVHDISKATKRCVLVSHSACIWDVKNLCCENMHDPSLACVTRGCSGGVSFATCSADGTIRLWDLALQPDSVNSATDHLLNTESGVMSCLVSAGIFERDTMETSLSTQGIRSMAASSDGKYLAAGDCEGNLHIYDLKTSDYTCFQGVHDAEILSLSFSLSNNTSDNSEVEGGNYFLASGGRDRIIHLYDVKRNFNVIESIDDHSAAVTSVKLTCHDCKILSCSADRSLVFRDVSVTDGGHKILRRHHQIASNGTVYDMAVDPTMKFVVTVGQDKKINTFNIASGKLIRSFKQNKDFGDPIKVTMDPSYSYLVCSYSNKSICIYDSVSGEMVVQVMGHGEIVTGVIFLPDSKHVVSVACDGCIFIWQLPARISSTISQRMKENSSLLTSKSLVVPAAFNRIILSKEEDQQHIISAEDILLPESNQFAENVFDQGGGPRRLSTFRFSISRLPMWAQSKVSHSNPGFISSQPEQQVEDRYFSPVVSNGEYSPFFHEAQTPLSLNVQGNASCLSSLSRSSPEIINSQTSPMSQETLRCFPRNRPWLNVYTVCLDLLNSPEAKLTTDLKMPVLSSNLSDQGLHKSRSQIQTTREVDYCNIKSRESNLFKRHFCSLSASCKMESSKSSVRKRYSARYVVRRDYAGDRGRLFGTPDREAGKPLKDGPETTCCITSENPAGQNLEEVQETNSCKQEEKSIQISTHGPPTKYSLAENLNNRAKEATKQKECIPEEKILQQKTTACREALLHLDAATQDVLNLFTELGSLVSKEEILNLSGAKLFDEAGKLLPSIAEKLDALAELVQCRNKYSCRNGVNVSEFEPLLKIFAENLSENVMEIVKKNLNKD